MPRRLSVTTKTVYIRSSLLLVSRSLLPVCPSSSYLPVCRTACPTVGQSKSQMG